MTTVTRAASRDRIPDAERLKAWTFARGAIHMTLEEARDKYLWAMQHGFKPYRRPATLATMIRYREELKRFTRWAIVQGRQSVRHFNTALVDGYLEHRSVVRKVSPNTLSLDSVILRGFAAFGVYMRYWRSEDVADIQYQLKPRKLPRPLNGPHREAIMKLPLSVEETALRALLYYAGLRNMEITGARLQDVFPPSPVSETETISAKIRLFGKGGKERFVDLHDDAWADLVPHVRARLQDGAQPEHMIFVIAPTYWGRGRPTKAAASQQPQPWSDQVVQRRVKAWADRVGMGHVTPHALRHTFASAFLEANPGDIETLRELLGHASIQTTQIYVRLSSAHRAAAVRRMPGFRPKTQPHDTGAPDLTTGGPENGP